MTSPQPLIRMHHVGKHFGAFQALKDLNPQDTKGERTKLYLRQILSH